MAYRAQESKDRWKAMAAAVAVTSVLGAGILTGLNVEMIGRAVDRLQTFDITLPKPPPPEPPPEPRPKQSTKQSGSPVAPKASPVVAPKPEVQLPTKQVIAAAVVAGSGSSSANGQGGTGSGTGSGGSGGGAGSGAGFTPARKITKIPDREYRQLAAISGLDRGSVGVSIRVNSDGSASNCRVVRSSGSTSADSLMCRLTERYVRFRPALDPQGRPVAQQVTWYPNWWR